MSEFAVSEEGAEEQGRGAEGRAVLNIFADDTLQIAQQMLDLLALSRV
jgi:hypothetical protein